MSSFCTRLDRTLVGAIPVLALTVTMAQGQAVPSDSAIRAILKERVDSGNAPAILVGILEKGHRRYVAYGSNGPTRPPVDEHTLFEIGSISKTFTGLLLADAVVRSEVRLDQPVSELLGAGGKVPSREGKAITLQLLSTHRSGLPRLPSNFAPANIADPYSDYDAKLLGQFLSSYALPRAPGDSAEYSNLGAGLLGYALALRAKTPSWGALVDRRITAPLGMRETFVVVPSALQNRVAVGHDERLDSVSAWHFDALAGAGALHSTAADMLVYLAAQLDTTSGPLRHAVALGRTPRADFAPGTRIALGWMIVGQPSQPMWWHGGATAGFRTFVAFDPARQLAVVVLANSANTIDDIGMHLLNPLTPLSKPIRPPRVAMTLPAAALDRFAGEYQLTPALVLIVARVGDALFARATGQPAFPLTASAANRFVYPAAGIEMVFDTSETGSVRQLTFRQGGGTIMVPALPPRAAVTLSTAALDRLVGAYPLTPALLLAITRDGDILYGQATGQPRFPLTATAANRFVFPLLGIEIVFDTSETGSARGLTFRQDSATLTAPRRP
ncbi:MAG: penicillin-binding protein AmpH [Gemmatimonadetes bacterium]|nr:penicillin-binding protein AmpH [Gemmatimonadota bacterium]